MTLYCGTHNWLCVQKMLNHGLNHVFFSFTFQAYTLPNTLNCMYVSLFRFHIWILKQCCPKRPALPRHIRVWVSFELFGALCIYISGKGAGRHWVTTKATQTYFPRDIWQCYVLYIASLISTNVEFNSRSKTYWPKTQKMAENMQF